MICHKCHKNVNEKELEKCPICEKFICWNCRHIYRTTYIISSEIDNIIKIIIRLSREIGKQTFAISFLSIIPNIIIVFKPDEVEQNCKYAMGSLFTIYILFVIFIYRKVVTTILYKKYDLKINQSNYIGNLSKNMINWITCLISLGMQFIYLLGKNDKNKIFFDYISQLIPLIIIFSMTTLDLLYEKDI